MQRFRRMSLLFALLLVLTATLVPATPVSAEPVAPQVGEDDEVAVIEYPSGRIRIDDPHATGGAPFSWNSGTDVSWGFLAAGDFNGDGDAEIAAVKGGTLKVFDPFVQPGSAQVVFETTLSGGRGYRLIATGDLDNDGRDEIVATHTEPGPTIVQTLQIWDGGGTGTVWTMPRSESFGGAWDGIAMGDFNADSYDDVGLIRRSDNRIKVYSGFNWTTLSEANQFAGDWLAIAMGNISSSSAGDEMALTREDVPVPAQPNLILYRRNGSGFANLVDLTPYSYAPPFSSIGLGDANGDGDAEVLLLRNPLTDKTALLLVNPVGASMRTFEQSIGWGGTAWAQVRMGDVDGDGRDEPVVLRFDRYRVYWQVELDNSFTDYPGSYRAPSSVDFDRPTIALGNYNGQDAIVNAPLVVTPTNLIVGHVASAPASFGHISITRLGTSTAWTASIQTGFTGLSLETTAGTTPSTLMVRVETATPGTYNGTIHIQTTDPTVPMGSQDVQVTVNVMTNASFMPLIDQ